jgi:hypothetical protein
VTDLAIIAPKLANLIRRLSSDQDGEVVATAHALIRTLQSIGADIHDVADRIEHSGNGALSEHEMQEIFDAGVKTGIKQAEQNCATIRGWQSSSHRRAIWQCTAIAISRSSTASGK